MVPEDIKAGTFWVDKLRYNLKNSDVVLALLTNNYHGDDWTEQEIGLAWAFKKRILALSIDGNMGNGYVKSIQIKKFPLKFGSLNLANLVIDPYPTINDKKEFVKSLLKFGLLESRSFDQSNATLRIVKQLVAELEPAIASYVVEAYCRNDQVHNSSIWRNLIKQALCEDKPFIRFDERVRGIILSFIKEKQPEFYEVIQQLSKRVNSK